MKPKPISCTCEVMEIGMATPDGPVHFLCDKPTDYVMLHDNGGRVAACAEHAMMFNEHAGLAVRLAVTEIEKGMGKWV